MRDGPGETRPGWSALRVGPGGVPPEQVRPIGVSDPAPPASPPASSAAWPAPFRPGPGPSAGDDARTEPHAVLGSFDDGKPRRRAILAVTCLGLVALAVVIAGLLSSENAGTGSAADLGPGDCLASSGGTTVIALDCAAPEAEFVIAARFDHTTDDSRCFAAASDVVLVTRENAVMCLNYLARVGDCLYAGNTDDIGKAPCRTSGSTPRGLFRVIAVLSDTISTRGCPAGTLETLVHRADREVICLGMP
jgi:hypothetical protein